MKLTGFLLVPSDKLDEDTAAAIAAVSQGSNGAVRIKMHNKLAALVVLGKYLGMFDKRLAAIAFSNITKAVTWSCEEAEDGQRVKVLPVPSDKLDEDTAAAISAVSQSSTGALRIKMHNKLAALVVLGKYLGMFDDRPHNSNVRPNGVFLQPTTGDKDDDGIRDRRHQGD
jgi:hypothetical protein